MKNIRVSKANAHHQWNYTLVACFACGLGALASKKPAFEPPEFFENLSGCKTFKFLGNFWLAVNAHTQIDVYMIAIKSFFAPAYLVMLQCFRQHCISILTNDFLIKNIMAVAGFKSHHNPHFANSRAVSSWI